VLSDLSPEIASTTSDDTNLLNLLQQGTTDLRVKIWRSENSRSHELETFLIFPSPLLATKAIEVLRSKCRCSGLLNQHLFDHAPEGDTLELISTLRALTEDVKQHSTGRQQQHTIPKKTAAAQPFYPSKGRRIFDMHLTGQKQPMTVNVSKAAVPKARSPVKAVRTSRDIREEPSSKTVVPVVEVKPVDKGESVNKVEVINDINEEEELEEGDEEEGSGNEEIECKDDDEEPAEAAEGQ